MHAFSDRTYIYKVSDIIDIFYHTQEIEITNWGGVSFINGNPDLIVGYAVSR